ncbi:MAG TPA: hypothetical protein VIG99_19575 [Myxococcaceae bacterium]|jgi:hypothetical protein
MRPFHWVQATRAWALFVFVAGVVAREARADDSQFQLSFSMLATNLSYGDTPLAFKGGEAGELPGVSQMVEPFESTPFSGVRAYGLRVEERCVSHHLRLGLGFQIALPRWSRGDVTGTYPIAGVDRLVSADALSSKDVRLSVGADLPLGPVHLYGDLVGTLRFISTTMRVDGAAATFAATTFGYAAELGASLDLGQDVRLALQAERGLVGEQLWGAALSVIFAFD